MSIIFLRSPSVSIDLSLLSSKSSKKSISALFVYAVPQWLHTLCGLVSFAIADGLKEQFSQIELPHFVQLYEPAPNGFLRERKLVLQSQQRSSLFILIGY